MNRRPHQPDPDDQGKALPPGYDPIMAPDYTADLSADYPPHLKHLAPTHEDLDMVREEVTGKPTDRGTALRNCAALEQRIAQLLRSKAKLLDRYGEGHDVLHFVADVDRELAKARELLAACELQLRNLN